MKFLGIETSCDETAAAIVESGSEPGLRLLSNVIASSAELHRAFGGVVPEIAARSHIEYMTPVIEQSLAEAKADWDDIDGIAVTYGPGLGGSLLVGVMTARTLAITKNKPLYSVNHVEAHPFATFLTKTSPALATTYRLPSSPPEFPMLALIVSGGHSQLVLFYDFFNHELLGRTRDDAVGEAFDKVAKILGLPYPGGPSISKAAESGNPTAFKLPKARLQGKYDFSFSGLKTAVLRTLQAECDKDYNFPSINLAKFLTDAQKNDMAASFQSVAVETLVDKTILAADEYQPKSIVIAGGVAANQELRRQLDQGLKQRPIYTDIQLCTDNGAMIAALGCFMAMHNQPIADPYSLDISPGLSM